MNGEKTVEERLAALEGAVAELSETAQHLTDGIEKLIARDLHVQANFMALFCLAGDLAERERISPEEFQQHCKSLFGWCHGQCLQKLEETSPNLAAEFDTRPIDDVATDPERPRMFGSASTD